MCLLILHAWKTSILSTYSLTSNGTFFRGEDFLGVVNWWWIQLENITALKAFRCYKGSWNMTPTQTNHALFLISPYTLGLIHHLQNFMHFRIMKNATFFMVDSSTSKNGWQTLNDPCVFSPNTSRIAPKIEKSKPHRDGLNHYLPSQGLKRGPIYLPQDSSLQFGLFSWK